jgi:hypothetical protein
MKPECEKCLMPDKSKERCIKRQCMHADMPPPPISVIPESRWHFEVGDIIGDEHIQINVIYIDEKFRFFDAQIDFLKDRDKNYGHFGSYVTEGLYYRFTFIGDEKDVTELIWEVKEEGTDRFHQEGSTGAQFLLYWFDDDNDDDNPGRFSFDLDS